ncbi:Hypothetical predicted protein [Octopus vulgaris]|uniref:Uncharacterized protein n=1 Tax=Octopus vulgaris TaxID=6645 RepID=A0AA36BJD5_OCTVU|nr:Hypothetical predicted protein [Octopus vulgaris]
MDRRHEGEETGKEEESKVERNPKIVTEGDWDGSGAQRIYYLLVVLRVNSSSCEKMDNIKDWGALNFLQQNRFTSGVFQENFKIITKKNVKSELQCERNG